jgi:hypothetical protein
MSETLNIVTLERENGPSIYCADCLEIARVDGTDAGRILTCEPGPVTGHCDGCDTDFGTPEVRS